MRDAQLRFVKLAGRFQKASVTPPDLADSQNALERVGVGSSTGIPQGW